MRLPAAINRDTLDVASLPPTDNTELNYRTKPLSAAEERQQTFKLLLSMALVIAPIGLVVSWFWNFKWLVLPLLITFVFMFLGRAFFQYTRERRQPWLEIGAAAIIVVSIMLAFVFDAIPSHRAGYGVVFPLTVAWTFGFAWLAGKQVAHWMANHPKVEWATARKWESFYPHLRSISTPADCSDVRSFHVAPLLLVLAYAFGWFVLLRMEQTPFWEFASLWGILGFAVASVVLMCLWNVAAGSGFSPLLIFRITWKALTVWCCYNRHETPAAGVFRFPTRSLRVAAVRDTAITATLVVLGAGLIASYPSLLAAESPSSAKAGPFILPHEEEFLKTLPAHEAVRHRENLIAQRTPRPPAPRTWANSIEQICARIAIAGVILTVGPGLLLILIMFTALGPLLTRYYLALEAPNGYAQSKDPEWDTYVDRIVQSKDALENEHYLLGMSLFGDYPVLLHQKILDQHYHITGDTGAAKTSLGIAPLATQMITKGKCSVVIIDLKGDMALFETMRKEAEREKRTFRWFASEPGKTSFVFNPFVQSHLGLLTPEQRTESLLQAMSLDYGVGYGKSFFTAMNEVVLKNMLRKYSIKSFKELEGYLEDPASYKDLGPSKDFEQARHLAAIVNRLATMYPLNIVPGRTPGNEAAEEHAIDAMDVLHRPQVLYFFLSSPQEPIGAPSVAKLFLWALFSGAARKPSRNNRVYVFVDEFQQIISDSVKLVFEQIRDQGVTMIVAHQTGGQLHRQGTDLSETVESCTAVKQIFRASDLETIKKIEETSGQAVYHNVAWVQTVDPETTEQDLPETLAMSKSEEGLVQVSESVGPRLDRNTIIQISANPMASFVRFTSGSGYTQFGGFTTPIVSTYIMPQSTHEIRKEAAWPIQIGTVTVPFPSTNVAEPEKVPAPEPEVDWDARLRPGVDS
jgi:hypothetical protein